MIVLLLFALLAGAATALSPCALPVVPALLSASATGGRRRPLGIVLGLSATFAITIVGLAEVAGGVGLGDGALRGVAIVALLVFGIAVAVPSIGARLEAPLSRLSRLGPRTRGDGFASGLGVGAALGFVYAPCTGPILAAVVTVGAASGRSIAVAAAYTLGTALVLLALALGGRRLAGRFRGPGLQVALGGVMIVTAVAMLARADIRLQTTLAQHLDNGGVLGFLADPAGPLERSGAVEGRLADLRGRSRFAPRADMRKRSGLPVLGTAPEFTGTQRWFNSEPLSLARLRGHVVLIDFWTYTCINCIRTQPYLKAWDARYRTRGLTIVGVHSPEFAFEKDAGNVRRAVHAAGLRYPVVQDNDLETWKAWGNQYWPAEYLVDANGKVRHVHFGEGGYGETEAAIRALLAEAGAQRLGEHARPRAAGGPPGARTTPETYLGSLRAERFVKTRELPPDSFALRGSWKVGLESATAGRGARIDARVHAQKVFLVLSSPGASPRRVRVSVDGRPHRVVTVRGQRLYTLVSLPRSGEHRLSLRVDRGLSGYAFTFG
jgi:cytochrome c biogenesis protein CcdA/thiol-disulfide isomerase/thioredoxin